ncbi:MAG: hypothetical protein JXR73_16240 [Candidatus Omnitrophica bacterium]|nr:hypothetical protein [Candidatus Omnitrophota bacterium]
MGNPCFIRRFGLIRRLGSLPVLLALFYIVFATPWMGRKNGYTVDATASFQLTKTIILSGDWLPDNLRVKQGYIYSIVYIPFYELGNAIAALNPDIEGDWIRRKCMCWMNTVLTGFTLGVLSCFVRRLGYSKTAQIFVPLIYGFSTLAFNYARYDYNKCLAAFLLLAAVYFCAAFMQEKRKGFLAGCGLAASALAALRLEMAIIAPVLLIALLYPKGTQGERLRRGVSYVCLCLIGIGWVFFYNSLYWSGEVAGGYEGGFQWNPMPGLMGFLFSPGKNIWFFNPVLLLLPLTLRTFYNNHKTLFPLWLGTVGLITAVYCFWGNWWGGWGWGPRHLTPLLPLLVLPIAPVFDQENRSYKILLGGLALAGLFVQFLGAVIDFNDVIMILMRTQISEQELIWQPAWNAIVQHGLVWRMMPAARWDFGWIGLKNYLSGAVFLGILFVWIGLAASLAWALIQNLRRSAD